MNLCTCWTPFSFLPYGTIVDDFQRQVYENPDWTPAERKAAWRQLEQSSVPTLPLTEFPYLEEGPVGSIRCTFTRRRFTILITAWRRRRPCSS